MLPYSVRQQFKTITDNDMGAWILIGPYQLCFSVPMHTDLKHDAAREVRRMYHRLVNHTHDYEHETYKPKYTSVGDLKSLRYFKQITDADLTDLSPDTLNNYLDSVNMMVYLNQTCSMCKHYITDVGIDDYETRAVTQCINCGYLEMDTIKLTPRRWVHNFIGSGEGTYTDD